MRQLEREIENPLDPVDVENLIQILEKAEEEDQGRKKLKEGPLEDQKRAEEL